MSKTVLVVEDSALFQKAYAAALSTYAREPLDDIRRKRILDPGHGDVGLKTPPVTLESDCFLHGGVNIVGKASQFRRALLDVIEQNARITEIRKPAERAQCHFESMMTPRDILKSGVQGIELRVGCFAEKLQCEMPVVR